MRNKTNQNMSRPTRAGILMLGGITLLCNGTGNTIFFFQDRGDISHIPSSTCYIIYIFLNQIIYIFHK